ncbi:MAG: hypothetical protein IPJ88_15340 [Myxococcales bacterium]|nr:MAG: hypothetical protein IPJ88_15340 [Myxococcales bacterium]
MKYKHPAEKSVALVILGTVLVCFSAITIPVQAQSSQEIELLVFSYEKASYGSAGKKLFLGCLNCEPSSPISIINENGKHGPGFIGAMSEQNLWSVLSPFRSSIDNKSICNTMADSPPVIVDRKGNFYGRLTVSKFHTQRSRLTIAQLFATALCKSR